MRTRPQVRDKTGIIFLFSLIAVVFIADFYIVFRGSGHTCGISTAERHISDYTDQTPAGNTGADKQLFSEFGSGSDSQPSYFPTFKYSFIFFLLASFLMTFGCLFIPHGKEEKVKSRYISFVKKEIISYASPRSPPVSV